MTRSLQKSICLRRHRLMELGLLNQAQALNPRRLKMSGSLDCLEGSGLFRVLCLVISLDILWYSMFIDIYVLPCVASVLGPSN